MLVNLQVFVHLSCVAASDTNYQPKQNMKYLIQFELDGQWITCATRSTFDAAKAKAKAERKAMMGARETSIIREGDPESMRYKACEQFQLA